MIGFYNMNIGISLMVAYLPVERRYIESVRYSKRS